MALSDCAAQNKTLAARVVELEPATREVKELQQQCAR